MKTKRCSLFKLIALIMVISICMPLITMAAKGAPVKLSSSKTKITVGDKATIYVDFSNQNYYYRFQLVNSNNGVLSFSNNTTYVENSPAGSPKSFTVTAKKPGKSTISVKDIDSANYDTEKPAPAYGSLTIEVVEKTTKPKPKPSTPKPPQLDNTEQEKKTLEELEKEELAKRMKTPLIKEIDIISNSERLKGKSILSIKPESQKFEYSGELPGNIDNISLKISTIKDDVELEYQPNITIEKDKDSIEFVIKATQDKLVQEFKITLKKPEKSNFQIKEGNKALELIVDPYMDKAMEELGFEKVFINEEDPALGFYFSLDKKNYIIAADKENNGYIYLLDEKNNPVKEVFLVSNKDKKVFMLVNEVLGENDKRLLKGNPYEEQEITISKLLTDSDPTIKFNNKINGWVYDEDAIITHGLVGKEGSELVYMDSLSNVKSAFVQFDEIQKIPSDIIKFGGYGLWIITLIAFIIYGITNPRKSRGRH